MAIYLGGEQVQETSDKEASPLYDVMVRFHKRSLECRTNHICQLQDFLPVELLWQVLPTSCRSIANQSIITISNIVQK